MKWAKVAQKWLKWTLATAGAGLVSAASGGQDVSDPAVLRQVAVAAILSGLFGGGVNAAKHVGDPN